MPTFDDVFVVALCLATSFNILMAWELIREIVSTLNSED